MKKAQAVSYYLQNKGIESNHVHLFSRGESESLVPNTPAENRPLTKRVTLPLVDR